MNGVWIGFSLKLGMAARNGYVTFGALKQLERPWDLRIVGDIQIRFRIVGASTLLF